MVLKQHSLKTSNKHNDMPKQIMPQTKVNVKCAPKMRHRQNLSDQVHIKGKNMQ